MLLPIRVQCLQEVDEFFVVESEVDILVEARKYLVEHLVVRQHLPGWLVVKRLVQRVGHSILFLLTHHSYH